MSDTTNDGSGGFTWLGARVLAADIPIDVAAAEAMVPPELTVTEPAGATVFVADYPRTSFGSVYREAAVLIHVADDAGPAIHCPWMVVDDDTALIYGRELLGFPKKLAEITLTGDGDAMVGTVSRKGVEVLRIEAMLAGFDPDPAPLFARRMVNVFGSIIGGMKLLELPAVSEVMHSVHQGTGKVVLRASERDPLGALAATVGCTPRFIVEDFGGTAEGAFPTVLGDVDPIWSLDGFFSRAR